MGNQLRTIMAMFNSHVKLPEGILVHQLAMNVATHQWKSDRIVIPWKLKRYHEAGKPQTLKWLASMCIEVVTLGAVFHGYFTPSVNDASWIWGWIFPNRGLRLTPSATHLVKSAWWHLSQILHSLLRRTAVAREGALLWNLNAGHGGCCDWWL